MKLLKTFSMGMVVLITLLTAPLMALAQTITVYPEEFDFGDVVIGSSSSTIFDINNHTSTNLQVAIAILSSTPVDWSEYNGEDFKITVAPSFPVTIPGGGSVEVEVTFSPTGNEYFEAWLYVFATSGDPPETFVHLSGQGVDAAPPVAEIMNELIELFNASVDDGSIEGHGPESSAPNRLRAFGHILDAANDFVVGGYEKLACSKLLVAYEKSDDIHPPPDFIQGDNREAINNKIVDVMEALGCFE